MASSPSGEELPPQVRHQPVLYHEIIHALRPRSGGFYIDGTLGAGGHAWGILNDSAPDGKLLGMDLDPQALELARQRLAPFGSRTVLVQASYVDLDAQLSHLGWPPVDGIVLDLGVSSMQFDTPERGFSFAAEAPLDMRFSPDNPTTAADLVNRLPERDLADLIFRYGEERRSRQIAAAIVRSRPITTTRQLAEMILRATGGGGRGGRSGEHRSHIHPATLTFQALRIAVNRELEAIETVLPVAMQSLAPGGRLAIISFHSLEDRLIKNFYRQESRDCLCPPRQPTCTCGHHASLVEITRRPMQPGPKELEENPRARSAKLRVAEKLEVGI